VVHDILRRASNLGGLLVVAFVTPIPGNGATNAAAGRTPTGMIQRQLSQVHLPPKPKRGARKPAASPGHR
jgi:hypothetical protein